jgi:hypothetical protein
MELAYRVLDGNHAGAGRTVDMSNRGLCCSGMESLAAGTVLEISLSWPVHPESDCPLKLVVVGRVLRSHAERTAIGIDRYKFHMWRQAVSTKRGNSAHDFQAA